MSHYFSLNYFCITFPFKTLNDPSISSKYLSSSETELLRLSDNDILDALSVWLYGKIMTNEWKISGLTNAHTTSLK